MRTPRLTSLEYARPYRPRAVALLDRLPIRVDLSVGSLLDAARRRAGARDLGDPWVLEPLEHLVRALDDEAELTITGRMLTRSKLVSALMLRIRRTALLRAHPEIEAIEVADPIVITGLQRTGSTMLHRLLATDPRLRSLRSFEALSPIPPPFPLRFDRRLWSAALAERTVRWLAPDFFAVHPIEARAPEEEIVLLDHSFLSTVPEATYHVPTFASWAEQQDQTPAYLDLRRWLQVLAWNQPPRRWLLKTPHHLEWLDVLFDVFPRATVIQTHRDPLRTLASFCSMVAHGRGVFSDRVDPREIGRHWLRKIGRMLERGLATRSRRGDASFVDVAYADTVDDPESTLARVYEAVGWARPPGLASAVEQWLASNPADKYGRHRYELGAFGLSPEDIEHELGFYRRKLAGDGAPSMGRVGTSDGR